MNLQELVDKRVKLIEDARGVLDTLTDDTAEGEAAEIEARFDTMMVDADKLKDQIDRERRMGDAEDSLSETIERRSATENFSRGQTADVIANDAETESRAFDAWIRGGMDSLDTEQRQTLWKLSPESRALGVGSNTSGGFTVPEGFRNELEESMLAFGGMRDIATVFNTAGGGDLPMPTVNDTGNKGELLAENATAAAQDVAFGAVVLGAYKYSSKIVLVSWELLQDSAFNMQSFLAGALGTRIARITNDHFTTGTGVALPNGIVNAASSGKTAAATNAITASELIDLVHSVDPAYRANARFMMADTWMAVIKKLTVSSTDSRPLWMPGYVAGEPDTIMGYGYSINQSMASGVTASTIGILFGDFSKYMIRNVRGVELIRLNERYADQGQVGFLAWSRQDGDLLDAGTDPVKYLDTPAT